MMNRSIKFHISLLLLCVFVTIDAQGEVAKQTTGPKKGSLIVVGGGGDRNALRIVLDRFVKLAGGKDARIVVVPTAISSREDYDYTQYHMARLLTQRYKLKDVQVVHTHDRKVANTKKFVKPITKATGVWFSGGRQWRFTKAYRGTLAEKAFHDVLTRGGVIAGSSAGATIQGSFLARGDTQTNTIMVGNVQHGFGFIKNVAIDQHIVPRKRQLDMLKVLDDPQKQMWKEFDREALLGIGVDEDTAMVVKGNQFEVIGKKDGLVFVYDPRKWKKDTQPHDKYITLKIGEKYDLFKRNRLHSSPKP